jgi:hypothetical protein
MLDTTQEMYVAFLDGIKKSYTGTIVPEVWNRLINEWGQSEWLRRNVSDEQGIEFSEKQIADLEIIRNVTDGVDTYQSTPLFPIVPDLGSNYVFTYPVESNMMIRNDQSNLQAYPKFYRLLNVQFKINYIDNECGLTGVSEWLDARIMRSDQRVVFSKSPYRCPKDDRLYYERINGKLRLITGTSSTGHSMRLEYLRWPRRIFFDALHPADAINPDYIPSVGSVNCEFRDEQRKEIVETCVRMFLERAKDPRYQTYMNEEIIRANSLK